MSSRTTIKSVPETISFFRLDKCARASKTTAGLIFAKVCNSLRRASSPVSGRLSLGRSSYLGPPIAAINTASTSFTFFLVSSGKGEPVLSIATPPRSNSIYSKLGTRTFRTFTVSSVISGPIPSPGINAIVFFVVIPKILAN